jgi:hypothetical protein
MILSRPVSIFPDRHAIGSSESKMEGLILSFASEEKEKSHNESEARV